MDTKKVNDVFFNVVDFCVKGSDFTVTSIFINGKFYLRFESSCKMNSLKLDKIGDYYCVRKRSKDEVLFHEKLNVIFLLEEDDGTRKQVFGEELKKKIDTKKNKERGDEIIGFFKKNQKHCKGRG